MKLEKKIELGKKMRKKANTQIANLKKRVEKSKPTSNGTILKVPKGTLKRKSDSEKTIEAAKLGKILPFELQKEKNSLICSDQACKDCPFIPRPFEHFTMNFSLKEHFSSCHLCRLYKNDGLLNNLGEEVNKGYKKKSNKQ